MKKQLLEVASLVILGVAAGCGSSSDGNVTSPGPAISGKVADGYLEGATVFLDKNSNYRLDDGEPSAVTDKNGAYTLNVDAADIGRYHILALATAGVTIDSDNPGVPIGQSYLLSLHRLNVSGTVNSNFISPMSTQLREMMETGNYATMQEAMEALRAKLGLPVGTNMMSDFITPSNPRMHAAAQDMAALMGGQMEHVYGTGGSSTAVDVNRYRGMMGMIFSNISSVRGGSMTMSGLRDHMSTHMGSIMQGQPFPNMSSMYRSGAMGSGMTGGGMMGGGTAGMYNHGDAGQMPH